MKAIVSTLGLILISTLFLGGGTPSAQASWAKAGFLDEQIKKEKKTRSPLIKRGFFNFNEKKAKEKKESEEEILQPSAPIPKEILQGIHCFLAAAEIIKQNPSIVGVDPWAERAPPKLWCVWALEGYHDFCPQLRAFADLSGLKKALWFPSSWESEKIYNYSRIIGAMPGLVKSLNDRTKMVSFYCLNDMRLALLYTLKKSPPELPILELGPGIGLMTKNFLVLGAKVTIVDNDQGTLQDAVRHFEENKDFLPKHYPDLYTLECSDINDATAPFYQKKYWMINCENLLHFLRPKKIHDFLTGAYKSLYPGGLFFASVKAHFSNQREVDLYLSGRARGEAFPGDGGVHGSFNQIALEELKNVIKKHGFHIEEAFYVDFFGNKTEWTCFTLGLEKFSPCVIARKPVI